MSLPVPKLDDKQFQEFFEEARALIPRFAPQWTDHNFSDPGITLIDLFAWLSEMQLYFLDHIGDDHIRKFLRMAGAAPQPAVSARVNVSFTLPGAVSEPVPLPAGLRIFSTDVFSGDTISFETIEARILTANNIVRAITISDNERIDNSEFLQQTGSFFFAFGPTPAGSDALYLGLEAPSGFPEGRLPLRIEVFDADLPEIINPFGNGFSGFRPSTDLQWEYYRAGGWLPLTTERETTAALTISGEITLAGLPENPMTVLPPKLAGEGQGHFWIRASIAAGSYEQPPRIDRILLNTVVAEHAYTRQEERFSGNGLPFQQFTVKHLPVLAGTLHLQVKEADGTITDWQEVEDFDNSAPGDRHYTLEPATGRFCFGDGIRGRIPDLRNDPSESDGRERNIRVIGYRSGGGIIGNILAERISAIENPPRGGIIASNLLPAEGGAEAETLPEAANRARRELKDRHRTVTRQDFTDIVNQTPGVRIARVKVLDNYDPALCTVDIPGAITIVVVPQRLEMLPEQLPVPSRGFLDTITAWLEDKRLATSRVFVSAPNFIAVNVAVTVEMNPGSGRFALEEHIRHTIKAFFDPLSGGPDGDGWPFGRDIFGTEITGLVQNIEGVRCVKSLTLGTASSSGLKVITIPRTGLTYSGKIDIRIV